MRRRDFLATSGVSLLSLASADAGLAQSASPAATHTQFSESQLATYAANLRYEQLPSEVVVAIKRILIDTLACAYGAVHAEPVRIARDTYRQAFGGKPVAHLIGDRELMPAEGATLINGVMVRYLDLNDIYAGGDPAHPSECIAAAIACGEEAGCSGRDLITAIAVGYETQLAIVDAVGFGSRAFHSVSCAGFVTPLIAGKLWNMSAAQMANAVGISGPKQMTLLAINSGPISMMKALVYPSAAMEGVFAARLARNGFTGAAGVLEYFVRKTRGRTSELALDIGPAHHRVLNVGLKRFPLQFELQTVAEAGVDLHRELAGHLDSIQEIVVATSKRAKEATASPSRYEPKTKETADHSLPICLAIAIIEGDVTVMDFDKARWKAPDVLSLARKVRVEVLADGAARTGRSVVRIVLADGRSLEKRIDHPDGDPHRPMSLETVSTKFLQFAEPVLGREKAQRVLATCLALDELESLSTFGQALAG